MNKSLWIILGASGDLSNSKLIPAFEKIKDKLDLDLLLISRSNFQSKYRQLIINDYTNVSQILDSIDSKLYSNLYIHFALPPIVYKDLIEEYVDYLASLPSIDFKLILEKPFFKDISSKKIVKTNSEYILLMDHYAAKEIKLPRLDNIFDLKIYLNEKNDLGLRGGKYYDENGVVWDMFSSHGLYLINNIIKLYNPNWNPEYIIHQIKSKKYRISIEQYKEYRSDIGNLNSTTPTGMTFETVFENIGLRLFFESRKHGEDRKEVIINHNKVPILENELTSYGVMMSECVQKNYTKFTTVEEATIYFEIASEVANKL